MSENPKVTILDLFESKGLLSGFKENSKGFFIGYCPSCGRDEDGYCFFTIFPESNTCYCSKSKTSFDFTETAFLLAGEISCSEGRMKI